MYGEPKSKPPLIQKRSKLNKKKQVFLIESKEQH
jgi:hypothetical protein